MRVIVTAQVSKLCPHKDERDFGTVTLTFYGEAPELHEVAKLLHSCEDVRISHEQYTDMLRCQWEGVEATTTWTTAGLGVVVEA